MKTIKLNILASDIIQSEYHRDSDCAITRALKRAGEEMTDVDLSHTVGGEHNETYENLLKKVLGMYGTKDNSKYTYGVGQIIEADFLPIEDFEHEVIFEE